MELSDVQAETARLSNYAHLATVGADGAPDVVPVFPAWLDGTVWIMTHATSVKARNVAANPQVALSWQVGDAGDSVEVWGTATVHGDAETRHRLWTGVFAYNLDDFSGGVDDENGVFIAVEPSRALVLKAYGLGGRDVWKP